MLSTQDPCTLSMVFINIPNLVITFYLSPLLDLFINSGNGIGKIGAEELGAGISKC